MWNIRFVWNLTPNTTFEFYYDEDTVTSFIIYIKYGDIPLKASCKEQHSVFRLPRRQKDLVQMPCTLRCISVWRQVFYDTSNTCWMQKVCLRSKSAVNKKRPGPLFFQQLKEWLQQSILSYGLTKDKCLNECRQYAEKWKADAWRLNRSACWTFSIFS